MLLWYAVLSPHWKNWLQMRCMYLYFVNRCIIIIIRGTMYVWQVTEFQETYDVLLIWNVNIFTNCILLLPLLKHAWYSMLLMMPNVANHLKLCSLGSVGTKPRWVCLVHSRIWFGKSSDLQEGLSTLEINQPERKSEIEIQTSLALSVWYLKIR